MNNEDEPLDNVRDYFKKILPGVATFAMEEFGIKLYPSLYPLEIVDRQFLHTLLTSLLITAHPKLMEWRQVSQQQLGIPTIDFPDTLISLVELEEKQSPKTKRELDEILNSFFAKQGSNLFRHTWDKSIRIWLLTNKLPLPRKEKPVDILKHYPSASGRTSVERIKYEPAPSDIVYPLLDQQTYEFKTQYNFVEDKPVIILNKRFKSFDDLSKCLYERFDEISELTKHLPDYTYAKFVSSVANLALGLLIFNHNNAAEDEEWINKQYKADNPFFNKEKIRPRKTDFKKFRSNAKRKLNELYLFD